MYWKIIVLFNSTGIADEYIPRESDDGKRGEINLVTVERVTYVLTNCSKRLRYL